MTVKPDLILARKRDTLTDHHTQGSGNSIDTFIFPARHPRPSLAAEKKTEDISDIVLEKITPELVYSDDVKKALEKTEMLFEEIKELDLHERNLRALSRMPSLTVNVSDLIDQDTARLDVFSDGIGPALLSVLHEYGPMDIEQILEWCRMDREVLISRLETLRRNGLVRCRQNRYFISDEGISLSSRLILPEQRIE